ncbi:MFS transporter [Actinokineospora sp. 24-640]
MTTKAKSAVLRDNRDFALLWSGHAASTFGSQLSAVAVPLLVLSLTASPVAVGVVAAVGMVTTLVARLPAGALADRLDRRTTMIWCDLGRAAAVASLAAAAWLDMVTLPHVVCVAVVVGLLTALFAPAGAGALPRVVPRADLPTAMTRNQLRDQTASLVGPPTGGFLFAISRALPFTVDVLSFLASAFLIGRIRTDLSPATRRTSTVGRDIADGLRWLAGRKDLVLLMLWSAVTNFTLNGVAVGIVVVAVQGGSSPFQIGVMQALGGVGGVLGALAASRIVRAVRLRTALLVTGVAWSALFCGMAFTTNPYALGALFMLTIAVAPTTAALVNTALVASTPDEMYGRVNSTAGLVASSANPLGPIVMGVLLVGAPHLALPVFGLVVGLGTLGYLVADRRIARERTG